MSKKILYIVNDINFFVSHRLEIALSAKKEGFQIHLACPRSDYKFNNKLQVPSTRSVSLYGMWRKSGSPSGENHDSAIARQILIEIINISQFHVFERVRYE